MSQPPSLQRYIWNTITQTPAHTGRPHSSMQCALTHSKLKPHAPAHWCIWAILCAPALKSTFHSLVPSFSMTHTNYISSSPTHASRSPSSTLLSPRLSLTSSCFSYYCRIDFSLQLTPGTWDCSCLLWNVIVLAPINLWCRFFLSPTKVGNIKLLSLSAQIITTGNKLLVANWRHRLESHG